MKMSQIPLARFESYYKESEAYSQSKKSKIGYILSAIEEQYGFSYLSQLADFIEKVSNEIKSESHANILNQKLRKDWTERTAREYFTPLREACDAFQCEESGYEHQRVEIAIHESHQQSTSKVKLLERYLKGLKDIDEDPLYDDDTKKMLQSPYWELISNLIPKNS